MIQRPVREVALTLQETSGQPTVIVPCAARADPVYDQGARSNAVFPPTENVSPPRGGAHPAPSALAGRNGSVRGRAVHGDLGKPVVTMPCFCPSSGPASGYHSSASWISPTPGGSLIAHRRFQEVDTRSLGGKVGSPENRRNPERLLCPCSPEAGPG